MNTLLVPTDFSEHSEYALEVAAVLANRFGAKLVLFHMIGVSPSVFTKSELEEQEEVKYYLKLAREKLKSYLDKPFLQGVPMETVIQNLKDFEEVDAVAKEKKADLIVMGSHGSSGLNAFFVGSNTEKVVRNSETPILVVKTKRPDFHISQIVFASDLQPETVVAFKKVSALANEFNAKLKVVYVNTIGSHFKSDNQIQQNIQRFREAVGKEVPISVYNDYSIEAGIYNYAQTVGADLVAIPTHGKKGLAHFFLGSVGENLANTAALPVLTIKI